MGVPLEEELPLRLIGEFGRTPQAEEAQPLPLSLEQAPRGVKLSTEQLRSWRGEALSQASAAHYWDRGGPQRDLYLLQL